MRSSFGSRRKETSSKGDPMGIKSQITTEGTIKHQLVVEFGVVEEFIRWDVMVKVEY